MENPPAPRSVARESDVQLLAEDLVASAQARGVELTGEGRFLTVLMKQILQSALEAEMAAHLGYDKHDPMGRDRDNSRNGYGVNTI
jgi:transposase-like protein